MHGSRLMRCATLPPFHAGIRRPRRFGCAPMREEAAGVSHQRGHGDKVRMPAQLRRRCAVEVAFISLWKLRILPAWFPVCSRFSAPLPPKDAIRCIDFRLNPSPVASTSLVPPMRPHLPVVFPTRAMVCKRLCLNSYPRASVAPVRRAIPPADCVIHPEEKASEQPRAADCQRMQHWEGHGATPGVVLRRSFVRRVPILSS